MSLDLDQLQHDLYEQTVQALQAQSASDPSEEEVRVLVNNFFDSRDILLPSTTRVKIVDQVVFSIVGLGPLEFLLRDESVSEIMVNGKDTIYIEKEGKVQETDYTFLSEEQLIGVINRIVGQIGRRIDESTPLVDARLEDGSRVNAVIPPLSLVGPVLTIRKFPTKTFQLQDMLDKNSISSQMADFLRLCIESKQNILISGGTGAGKTSTLNAFASLIPHGERIVTIEDAAEIRIEHPHLISLESRPPNIEGKGEIPIRTLVKNALRMRPDRIVVGEIRSAESIDMLQAMNTGHKGSLTTVHANAPLESLFRVETMVLMGGIDMPISAIRPQVIQGIDIVVQQARLRDGSRKIIEIAEVQKDLTTSEYSVETLFKYDLKKQEFIQTKFIPKGFEDYQTHNLWKQLFNMKIKNY